MSEVVTNEAGRAVEAEQYQEQQKKKRGRPKKLDTWYEASGVKVVKKTRSEHGHVHSEYVGKLKNKEVAALVLKHGRAS